MTEHLQALHIRDSIGDKVGIANSYNSIGVIYKDQGNYAEAMKNFFLALKVYDKPEDQVKANAYSNIGVVYAYQPITPRPCGTLTSLSKSKTDR